MKKLLSTIMALVMLLSLVPMAVAEEGAGTETGAVQSNSVYEVSEAAQLIWAAENHTGVVKLMNDVEIEETVIVTKTIKLDMNGKKLFNTKDIWNDSTGHWSLVSVRENGDLTITGNGMFAAKENDVYAIDLFDDDVRCTIENGTFVGNISAVYVHDGQLIVNGGEFSIRQTDNNKPHGFTLNCLDESYADGSAQIIVNGGSFYKYNPAESISENPAAAFSRCGVVQSGDYYNVTAPVAMIGEKGYATLAAAVADVPTDDTETTITLLRDVNDAHGMAVASGKNFTVDFGGHTYTVTKPGAGSSGTETNAFQLLKDSTVTFKNGTIKCDPNNLIEVRNNKNKVVNVMRIIQDYAALTLEDMVIDGTNLFGDGNLPMSFNNQPVTIKGSTSVILKQGATTAFDADGNWGGYNRCKVTVDTTGTIDGDIVLGQGYLDIQNANVKGGIVLCTSCGTNETEGQSDRITISGGAFNVAPDAKYLAKGMIVVPSTDGTFTVKPKTSQEGNATTTTEVSEDGKTVTETVTETKTDGNTVTKTETNVDTGAATVTKTENKNEGNVATRTETVTVKDNEGNVTKATETVTTVKTENGGTTTVVTEKDTLNKTETTEVTGVTAPTTASDVTLDVKNTTNVAVNKASMAALTGDTVKDVVIETDKATLKLNKTAVTTMAGNVPTNGKMTLNVTVTEEKNATTTDIEKVKVEVTAKNEAGQNVFPENTANTNGLINITIPYTGNATQLDLWYIAANASATYMGRFPVVNGFVSFDVKHFSQYDLIPVASSGSSVIKTGAGSSAASTTQTVTTDLTPGSITKVTVDGKVVDAKYYTVSGSNVTFTAEFLKTLKNGSHTVTVENATKIAKGVFTVNNPTTAVQAPTTADAGIALYAGMAIASVMGTGVVFTSRKRKNH